MMKTKIVLLLFFVFSTTLFSQINIKDAVTYYNRGIDKSELGDYIGAIQDYNKALKINPKNDNAYLFRGLNKYHLEDYRGACLDFSKAGELGDEDAYEIIKEYCN